MRSFILITLSVLLFIGCKKGLNSIADIEVPIPETLPEVVKKRTLVAVKFYRSISDTLIRTDSLYYGENAQLVKVVGREYGNRVDLKFFYQNNLLTHIQEGDSIYHYKRHYHLYNSSRIDSIALTDTLTNKSTYEGKLRLYYNTQNKLDSTRTIIHQPPYGMTEMYTSYFVRNNTVDSVGTKHDYNFGRGFMSGPVRTVYPSATFSPVNTSLKTLNSSYLFYLGASENYLLISMHAVGLFGLNALNPADNMFNDGVYNYYAAENYGNIETTKFNQPYSSIVDIDSTGAMSGYHYYEGGIEKKYLKFEYQTK